MENTTPLRTLIVGHVGQYPFVQQDLQDAKKASMTDPENSEDEITKKEDFVWEDIISVDKSHVTLSVTGKVLHHRVRAIQTTQPEEEIAVKQRLEEAAEIADYGFDHPHELY